MSEQFNEKIKLFIFKGEGNFEMIKYSLLLLTEDEKLKILINEIEPYENYNGTPLGASSLFPLPKLSGEQYRRLFDIFAEDPAKLKWFIGDVLERQATLNIQYVMGEQIRPFKNFAGDFGNFAFVLNHHISRIPDSQKSRYKNELLEIKQEVENIKTKLIPILDELEESLKDI